MMSCNVEGTIFKSVVVHNQRDDGIYMFRLQQCHVLPDWFAESVYLEKWKVAGNVQE
jgi:hypothetical protein